MLPISFLTDRMMRLFLYLLALVAGFTPAQASRAALAEPVAVGVVRQPVRAFAAVHARQAHVQTGLIATSRIRPVDVQTSDVLPALNPVSIRIALTDRPRA